MSRYKGPSEARRRANRKDYAKNKQRRIDAMKARYREKLGLGGMTKREAKNNPLAAKALQVCSPEFLKSLDAHMVLPSRS